MKILILLLAYILSLQAIITIAPAKIGAKPGWSGTIEGSFQTKRGNTDKDDYSAGIRVQYDNNSTYLIWSDFIGVYGKANDEENTNKTYAHVRYVHTMVEHINWELFLQSETNKFTSVKKRRLGGGGLRFHYDGENIGDFYLGVGSYYETLDYTTDIDPSEHNIRINTYIAYVKTFNHKHSISYVAYYQPRVDKFSDYITSQAVELKLNIYKAFNLKFKLYYDIDSSPAIGREKEDFTQLTSFSYDF